jgi:hypothetical protein
MLFKGQNLEVGDFVAFQTRTVPLPEVQGAVIDVNGGVLEVLSTLLFPFRHSGSFTEDDVDCIMVVYLAEVAIPQESRGKGFAKHQRVGTTVRDGSAQFGEVIAAFDGIVVARRSDGELITGGASHFEAFRQ